MTRRRGVSLTELLVVMSACGAVLTLSSSLVCRVMRIQIESRSQADVERNAMRLSDQFRQDVHQSRAAETSAAELGGNTFLRLAFADGRQAEYSRLDRTIVRRVTGDGVQASREEFDFPAACDVAVREIAAPSRITLTISTQPMAALSNSDKSSSVPARRPVSLHVESALGRDLRFTTGPPPEEATE